MEENITSEKGAIIVEASISFPFFIFAVVMFVSLIDICMTQAKIATALNVAAKEISEYSYLYILTGANEVQASINESGTQAKNTVDNTLTGLNTMTETLLKDKNAIMSDSDSIDVDQLMNDIQSVGSQGKDLYKLWGQQLSDPKRFIKSMAAVAANEGWDSAKTYLMGELLGKAFMVKNLKDSKGNGNDYEAAEKFLKRNHVVPKDGSYINGLDFDKTKIFAGGETERIQLVVSYEIHVVKLLNMDFNFKIQQCALTKAWGRGVDEGESGS